MSNQFFDLAYKKEGLLFGATPTRRLTEFLDKYPLTGSALDLGCGEGRDTIPLLNRGFQVTALDSSRVGIAKMLARSDLNPEMKTRLTIITEDIRYWHWPTGAFDVIIGTTVLDHIFNNDCGRVIEGVVQSSKPSAILFFEVHTTDDPGVTRRGIASEFASQIKHYFGPNELLELFQPHVRVLLYEERTEWDYDHGEPHTHGFATLIGIVKRKEKK